jgi:glycosyltransferase involved in cell wall biosynthesis
MVRDARATVIHVNSLHFQTSALGALAARRCRVPLVTTAHLAGTDLLARPLRDLVRSYEQTVGRLILSQSAGVVAVSDSVRNHLLHLGVPESKVTVVPNGVDTARFHPSPVRRAGPPRLAFVGRLVTNKGPDLFVSALDDLARRDVAFEAVVIGDGPARARMQRALADAGIAQRVSFTGRVSNVADLLRHVDILVRPSLTEGMPLAVLEAFASGVCVVASDVDGTSDIVRSGDNGLLFPPGDREALVACLVRVIHDQPFRAQLVAAGKRRARAQTWDRTAAATARALVNAATPTPA